MKAAVFDRYDAPLAIPLSKVNETYDRLRTGKVIGRIVLEP